MDAFVLVGGKVASLGVADRAFQGVELTMRFLHGTTESVQGPTTFTFGF